MKSKKTIIIISAAIVVLAALAFTVVSFAVPSSPTFDKPTLKLSVPSDPVSNGGSFTVNISVANDSITADKIAGVQVQLDFDNNKLTATSATPTLNTEASTAFVNINSDNVKFICVKDEFDDLTGYSELSALFSVTFTAKEAISDPTVLFDENNLKLLIGDVEAAKLDSAPFYGGNAEKISLLLLESDLNVTLKNKDAGSVIIVPTPAGKNALNTTEFKKKFSATVTVNTATDTVAVGTGSVVSYGGENVTVVIAGDVDGDGIVTVYDANIICKQNSDASNPDLTGAPKAASRLAGEGVIINHVIGKTKIN